MLIRGAVDLGLIQNGFGTFLRHDRTDIFFYLKRKSKKPLSKRVEDFTMFYLYGNFKSLTNNTKILSTAVEFLSH